MIEALVKKPMLKGIAKYAKEFGVSEQQVQIRITDDPNAAVIYEMCCDFKVREKATFLQVIDKKLDIFNQADFVEPVLKQALAIYANETSDTLSNVSAFIYKYEKTLAISYYNGFDNKKNILLGEFLSQLQFEF